MIRRSRVAVLLALTLATAATSGCFTGAKRRSAGVVDYLYADKQPVVTEEATPVLNLPLRVGIAFVPVAAQAPFAHTDPVVETEQRALMETVAERFRSQPFVRAIEVIPSAYLQPRGGFANLDQIRRMFGVDVVALVSYDQVQFTDTRRLSLTYWTILGAYLVKGEKNDTQTLLDAAIFDIPSRKLLFRAPGVSHVRGSSTPVNLTEELRNDARKGFQLAATDLTNNLERELDRFKERVRSPGSDVRIVQQPGAAGGTGGGAADVVLLALAVALAGTAAATRRRRA